MYKIKVFRSFKRNLFFVCQQHACLVLLLYFHYYFLLHFNVTLFSVSTGTQKIILAIIFDQNVLEKGT